LPPAHRSLVLQEKASLASAPLITALQEIYLGAATVVPAAKAQVAAELAARLK
jgi:hypothetical protein